MATKYNVKDLKPDSFFTSNLIIDQSFLLCTPAFPITSDILKALKDWNFTEVISDGRMGALTSSRDEVLQEQEKTKSAISNKESPDSNTRSQSTVIDHTNPELLEAVEKISNTMPLSTEKDRMAAVTAVYNEYCNYIRRVFTRYATHKQLDLDEISDTIKSLCIYIKDNKRFFLRIQPTMEARNRDFLVSHSMRTTTISIVVGMEMHIGLSKLVELGVTSLLHEIGMLELPPQAYMTENPLSLAEKKLILSHPVRSYNILKTADFPLSIQLGVLEHHERENGTGYPRHITGEKISLYAKIIAVACSYEAITAPRHFKEARTTYEGMIEMLKNESRQYDDEVTRKLLLCISLYPVGAFVYLTNGHIGQVVDVSKNPKNPIVEILGMKEPDGSPKKVQTDENGIHILRVMNKKEAEDVIKSIKLAEMRRANNPEAFTPPVRTM